VKEGYLNQLAIKMARISWYHKRNNNVIVTQ